MLVWGVRNKREKLQSEIIAGAELHEKSLRKIKFHIFFMLSTPSAAEAASHTAHRVGIRFEVVSANVAAVVDGSCCYYYCCCCYRKHE